MSITHLIFRKNPILYRDLAVKAGKENLQRDTHRPTLIKSKTPRPKLFPKTRAGNVSKINCYKTPLKSVKATAITRA